MPENSDLIRLKRAATKYLFFNIITKNREALWRVNYSLQKCKLIITSVCLNEMESS